MFLRYKDLRILKNMALFGPFFIEKLLTVLLRFDENYNQKRHLRWLKPVLTLERNILIRRIDTTTLLSLNSKLLCYGTISNIFMT